MNQFNRMRGFGRFSFFPPVLKALLIINIGVFILQWIFLELYTINGNSLNDYFMHYFALHPIGDESFLGLGNFYPWQLLTYQFMHSNLWHIGLNMFVLWMFGSELENLWGSRKFLIYYLLAGIGAGLVQLFISPIFTSTGPTIGASGSVYGILLAFGLTFPDRPIFLFPFFIPIPAKFFVLIFAGIELLLGFSGSDGVAHFAHLGGAATGFLLLKFGEKIGLYSFFDKILGKKKDDWQSEQSQPPEEEPASVFRVSWQKPKSQYQEKPKREDPRSLNIDGEEITQAKIDEILDKISESGYQSLSEREKKILFELSQKLK